MVLISSTAIVRSINESCRRRLMGWINPKALTIRDSSQTPTQSGISSEIKGVDPEILLQYSSSLLNSVAALSDDGPLFHYW